MAVERARLLGRPPARLELGRCLGTGLSAWLRNAPLCVLFNALVHAPLLAYTVSVFTESSRLGPYDGPVDSFQQWILVTTVATFFLPMITTGLVAYGVVQQLHGQRVSLVHGLAVGVRRLLPVVGVGLIVIVLVGGSYLLTALALTAGTRTVDMGIAGSFLVLALTTVPSFALLSVLWVAVPVAVLERAGLFGSLGRSRRLTKGSRWSIVGLLLVLAVGWFFAYFLVSLLTRSATAPSFLTSSLVGLGTNVVVGSVYAVANVVGYHHLRADKEGTTIEDLAKVFE